MKRFYLLSLLALLFTACTNDVTEDIAIEHPQQLTVSLEQDSRIQLNNGRTVWNEGDLLSVFHYTNKNEKWEFEGATGDRLGTIKRVSRPYNTKTLSNIVVVYPYNEAYSLVSKTLQVEASLPATQTYTADSFGVGSSIMVSASEDNEFILKNCCGWLDLQLCNDNEFTVEKIVLRGGNNEQLAGNLLIDSKSAEVTLAGNSSEPEDNTTVGGTLIFEDSVIKELTLLCPDGAQLHPEIPTHFYFALPPQTFSKGFTAEIYFTNGQVDTKSTTREIIIERNAIQPMSQIAVDITNVPNNTIYYTTIDNTILPQIRDIDNFGAEFVSHTFENGLGTITFNGDITSIGERAFASSNIKNIYIPDCVTNIKSEAFRNTTLTTIKLPKSLQTIGSDAFNNSTNLQEITIPYGVTTIDNYAFSYTALSSIDIPLSVEQIGHNAFLYCEKLEKFTGNFASKNGRFLIDNNSTLVGFAPCGLSEITVPDGVVTLGPEVFYMCSNLTKVELPSTLENIEYRVFYGCTSLTEITIPQSVTWINYGAFDACSNLTTFKGNFATEDGRLLVNPESGHLYAIATKGLTELTIPEGVIYLSFGSLDHTSSIEHLTLPASLDEVSSIIYNNENIKSITFKGSPRVYPYIVTYCPNLAGIYFPNATTPPVIYKYSETTSWDAFVGCPNLKIYVPTSSVNSFKAADGWKDYADIIVSDGSDPVTTLESPVITECIPGLGFAWIKFTKVPYGVDYQICSGDKVLEHRVVQPYDGDETRYDSEVETLVHVSGLDINATTPIRVKVSNPDIENASYSEVVEVKTGDIYQITDNVGPTSISIGWTEILPGGTNNVRAYAVQLATDKDMTNLIYDIYCRDGQANQTTSFNSSSWYGKKDGSNLRVPTAVAFGQLSPNTTYYFRIKTVGYTSTNGVYMHFPMGESDFSPVMSFTTEPARTAAENEVLYQGFDDLTLQFDFINFAAGTTPLSASKKETIFPHNYITEEYWCVYSATTTHKLSTWGISTMASFVGDSDQVFGKDNFVAGDKIPCLKGWNHADEVHPLHGYVKVGTSKTANQYIATPKIESNLISAEGTECTISFKACATSADQGTVYVKVYRDQEWTTVGNATLPRACEYTDANNYVYDGKWINFSFDTTIMPGDVVSFSSSSKLRFVIDDILITTK